MHGKFTLLWLYAAVRMERVHNLIYFLVQILMREFVVASVPVPQGDRPVTAMCPMLKDGEDILSLDPDAEAICEQTEFEAVCRASCNIGTVHLGGDGIFKCEANTSWVGALACERLDCGPVIADLDTNARANCSGDTRFRGDACDAR